MADYKIQIGAELRTKDIDASVKNYKGDVNVGAILNTKGIADTLRNFKAAPIEVMSILNTQGITDGISNYSKKASRKNIKVDVDPIFDGIEGKIKDKHFNTPLKVDVELNWSGIAGEIAKFKTSEKIKIDAVLNDNAITDAINNYSASKPIKIRVEPDFSELDFSKVEKLLEGYTARTPLKVSVDLSKTEINKKISEFNANAQTDSGRKILLNAALKDNAVADAISNYKVSNAEKLKIPIDLTFKSDTEFDTELKSKIQAYEATPVEIPVKLKPATKGFTNQISKLPVYVEAVLKNADDINNILNAYSNNPAPVQVKLVPAKNFDSGITKTPVKVQATLDPDSVNTAINNFNPTAKLKVGVKLEQKDINTEVKKLQKPTEPLSVDIDLNESSINDAIALFKPTATLGVKPDLIVEDIDDQIRTYVPKEKVKVHLDLSDSDIGADVGNQNSRPPINVNVKLDRDDINTQIRNFKTSSKIKVGVKLDFASHKDESGKEIQKGIANQIKAYQTKTKIRVGVQLDSNDIATQIGQINTSTPIMLGVQLDPNGVRNVENQINTLRQQIQALGNVNINFGGGNGGNGGGRGGRRQVDEATQAYRELLGVLNELNSKRLQLNGLDASSPQSSEKIQRLRLQIEQLDNEYNNLLRSFNAQGIQFTADQWNQLETIMERVGRRIDVVQAGMSDKSAIQSQTQAYRELLSVSKEISSLEINIEKLRGQGGNSSQIEVLENQLRTLQSAYQQLVTTMNTPLTNDQWSAIYTKVAKTSDEVEKLKAKYADAKAELSKNIKADINNGNLQGKINDVRESFGLLRIENQDVQNGLTRLQELLGNMDSSSDIESVTNDYKEFLQLLQTVENKVNELQRDQGNSGEMLDLKKESAMMKLNNLFEEGSQAAGKFGARARELAEELNACGSANIGNVTKKVEILGEEVKKSGLQTKTFSTRLKEQFSKYSQYFSIASVFMYATQAARSMFEQVKLIDSAMTELKKVTNETDASYNQFLSNAASRSKELGTTIDGLVSSTADFARLGYSFKEAQGLAEVANIYAVVGDEIEGVEDATQSLVSTLAAFRHEIGDMSNDEFAMSIVDKMNEVSNNYAISSGGIGEALQRSASSMAAANNTLDETIALITAANEVAQNPEKVGNAFKTMSMRIRGAKTE